MFMFVLFWLSCSIISYGLTLAYFQTEYPGSSKLGHVLFAIFLGIAGPVGLLNIGLQYIIGNYHFSGLQFLPTNREDKA